MKVTDKDFDWSSTSDWFRRTAAAETIDRLYEKIFSVNEGDTVVDLGASVGVFISSILDKGFSKCYAVEPLKAHHTAIKNNTDERIEIVHGAISEETEVKIDWDGLTDTVPGFTLPALISHIGVDRIDFLKTDCEGGEYVIFKQENIDWLKNHCRYCVGEWHLSTPELKQKFRTVRDEIFPLLKRVDVYSVDGYSINWNLYTEQFLNYYTEVIIHIEI